MFQAKFDDADGLAPIKESNEAWGKKTPCGADSDYICQAKAKAVA